METVLHYQGEILLILISIIFIQFLFLLLLNVKVGKIKKRLHRFTRGDGTQNIGQLLEEYNQEMETIKKELHDEQGKVQYLLNRLKKVKGQIGLVRYNAFGEQGNDLSYSIAILDEQKNGVVITSIYNREQSNTYAKPVENGESTYRLSEEEKKAIEKAIILKNE